MRAGSFRFWALVLVLALCPRVAHATYSIVATDTATREVGGSGTSCLSGGDVYIIYGSAPGVAAIHTQATYRTDVHDRGVELVRSGLAPADVIAALTDTSVDPDAELRQFAVVDVSGRSAAFTGSGDGLYAGDRQGSTGSLHYSAQGNILTSEAVLAQATGAFELPACDLAEHLMRALEAGADHGEGDRRCTDSRGIPSDSAFVEVDRAEEPAGSYLELHVTSSGDSNPLPLLRAEFDEWRQAHPCPAAGAKPGTLPQAPSPGEARESGCGCRVFGTPSDRPIGLRVAVVALLALLRTSRKASLSRWNARRFRC